MLQLSVKRQTWRRHDPDRDEADEAYLRARMDRVRKDQFTCQGCGFVSSGESKERNDTLRRSGFLEVHHVDDDHTNNHLSNLRTVCPFCHQVFHCGNAGHRGAGHIVYLPFISQARLNLLVNACAITAARDETFADDAKDLLRWLTDYGRVEIQGLFGAEATDASVFGSALMELAGSDPEAYKNRGKTLSGVRLMPDMAYYDRYIQYWAEQQTCLPYEKNWDGLAKQFHRSVMSYIQSLQKKEEKPPKSSLQKMHLRTFAQEQKAAKTGKRARKS